MENIHYRPMRLSDAEQAARIEKGIFSRPWTKKNFEESIVREDTLFLVAQKEERMFGYCGCYQSFEEGNITNVAVEAFARRQGIASGLLRELLKQGEKRGMIRFFLEVRVSNEAAVALYQKLGFSVVGKRRNFYEAPMEDAYIMMLQKSGQAGG